MLKKVQKEHHKLLGEEKKQRSCSCDLCLAFKMENIETEAAVTAILVGLGLMVSVQIINITSND